MSWGMKTINVREFCEDQCVSKDDGSILGIEVASLIKKQIRVNLVFDKGEYTKVFFDGYIMSVRENISKLQQMSIYHDYDIKDKKLGELMEYCIEEIESFRPRKKMWGQK